MVYRRDLWAALIVGLLPLLSCGSSPEKAVSSSAGAAVKNTQQQQMLSLLAAAEQQFDAQRIKDARRSLQAVQPRYLAAAQRLRYRVLRAELYYHERRFEQAAENLPEAVPDIHAVQRRWLRLRALLAAVNKHVQAEIDSRLALDRLLHREDPLRLQNRWRLWALLTAGVRPSAVGFHGTGWVALLTAVASGDVIAWQGRYGGHGATDFLPFLQAQQQGPVYPPKIAILLPFSGRYGEPAAALRDGLLTAYYATDAQQRPRLHWYDVGDTGMDVVLAYQQAVAEGADFVIGPLQKKAIDRLLAVPSLAVPVLSLNYASNLQQDGIRQPFYQFGLLPEDEAEQLARLLLSRGGYRVAVLMERSSWAERVLARLSHSLSALGGRLIAVERYAEKSRDFAPSIQHMLALDKSLLRRQRLQQMLGEELHFEPRRRQDVDAVILLSSATQARQLYPQIQFHQAHDVPVYASSRAYSGSLEESLDRDLNGLVFLDIPWLLPVPEWQPLAAQARWLWKKRFSRYPRLYAMGVDAYRLSPQLYQGNGDGLSYQGATGYLSMDRNRRLHRRLLAAIFAEGRPQLLPQQVLRLQ